MIGDVVSSSDEDFYKHEKIHVVTSTRNSKTFELIGSASHVHE
jgi:hypothetical protein